MMKNDSPIVRLHCEHVQRTRTLGNTSRQTYLRSKLYILTYFRYLFWVEHGMSKAMIYRSDLAGGNRKVIVTGKERIPDMVADPDDSKLYWLDTTGNAVETSDYDGNSVSRKIVHRSTEIYKALTSYKVGVFSV